MRKNRSPVFRGRHFQDEVIVLCVRWYLRYSFSYRDLEEMMAERGLSVDHSTVARWVLRYAPILNERMRPHLRRPNRSWRVDETYVRVAGKWTYLYRALDSEGNTSISCCPLIVTESQPNTSCNSLWGVLDIFDRESLTSMDIRISVRDY